MKKYLRDDQYMRDIVKDTPKYISRAALMQKGKINSIINKVRRAARKNSKALGAIEDEYYVNTKTPTNAYLVEMGVLSGVPEMWSGAPLLVKVGVVAATAVTGFLVFRHVNRLTSR